MGDRLFPIAKLLTPDQAEPWQIVTLDEVQWWRQITSAETASREDLLRCPYCDKRFEFCSGQTLGTYFRHRKGEGSCLGQGNGPGGAATPLPPNRTMWVRYKFARVLRQLLPLGTEVDAKLALTRLDGYMTVKLPDGGLMAVEVDCSPAGFNSLSERYQQHQQAGRNVIWVFSGKLVTDAIQTGPKILHTTLDPVPMKYMELVANSRAQQTPRFKPLVDQAYQADIPYPLPTAEAKGPCSLLFYLPGEDDQQLGALVGLRALMPQYKDLWTGALLRTEITPGELHTLRFSRRRGLYFGADVDVVKRYRAKRQEKRRQERASLAVAKRPPVSLNPPPAPSSTPSPLNRPNSRNMSLAEMVQAPMEQWSQEMQNHFLGLGQPFRVADACTWVGQHHRLHPTISPHDPRFMTAMMMFWETVAETGSVRVTSRPPIAVIPLRKKAAPLGVSPLY